MDFWIFWIFWGLVPGFVCWVLGLVCWVLGIVFWVLGPVVHAETLTMVIAD